MEGERFWNKLASSFSKGGWTSLERGATAAPVKGCTVLAQLTQPWKARAEPPPKPARKNLSSGRTGACDKIKSLRTEVILKESCAFPVISVWFCEEFFHSWPVW